MLIALLAALALGQPAAIDVPFVPQTEALCGGASAAMVFRYWGDAHADAEQFASLVVHRPGGVSGIVDSVLADAVRARGWQTASAHGSIDALQARLAARQPVIVLLSERGNRYHYVVVIGAAADGFIVHDPSWGPSRTIDTASFEQRWTAAHRWSLVVLPGGGARTTAASAAMETGAADSALVTKTEPADSCDADLAGALTELGRQGMAHADEILGPLREMCPHAAGPLRELAAARFAERRWREAAGLATEAIGRDPHDEYAHLVLGASLFMLDDQIGALRAWNAIGQPRLNQVQVQGLAHSRYQTITDALGLRPNGVLTADAFLRARHRLDELPDRASARIALLPEDNGYASVDVVIAERSGLPRGRAEWIATGIRTGVDREAAVSLPGGAGQGDVWSASWRWWDNRPRVGVSFAAPHIAGLFGVWRVDGSWEAESYATSDVGLVRETHAHGGLTVSDWMTGALRYSMHAGVDTWGERRTAFVGASLERRWLDDRLSLSGSATTWLPFSGEAAGPGFNAVGARIAAESGHAFLGWRYLAVAGVESVSDTAPMTLWPGAGEGQARTPLLRAHPLLDDGVIDVSGKSLFGRSVGYGSVEAQRWLERPALVRIGIAGFADVGLAKRQLDSSAAIEAQTDLGAGLRLRLPGASRVLRIDFAHGLRDGANAVSVGWSY